MQHTIPNVRSLGELLAVRADQEPDKLLLQNLDDGVNISEVLTFGATLEKAQRIATLLRENLSPGASVLLLYPPGLEFVPALFGCFFGECLAVPAYPPDPMRFETTLARLVAIAADADVEAVLTTSLVKEASQGMVGEVERLLKLPWYSTDHLESPRCAVPNTATETPAVLQYTSGSTGEPKGVLLSHENILATSALIHHIFRTHPDTVGVGWLPMYHDMGLIGNVVQPVYAGFSGHVMNPLTFVQRPSRWLEMATRFRATIGGGPNFAYEICARRTAEADRAKLDLSTWEVAFCGAEPLRAETVARFTDAFSPYGFRKTAFSPCYGLAEATLIVAGKRVGTPTLVQQFDRAGLEQNVARPPVPMSETLTLVSSGELLPNEDVRIVDPTEGVPREERCVGEIWVRGPAVGQGYWKRKSESAETFGARLADGSGPFLRTGDLGFIQNSQLYVTGRIKDLIIISGRNHYPQDLEQTAERAHPVLRAGCSVAFAIDTGDGEGFALVMEIKAGAGAFDADDVRGSVREAVMRTHGVVPADVVLVSAATIPKTTSGKLQRQELRRRYFSKNVPGTI